MMTNEALNPHATEQQRQLLSFSLAGEEYGIDILQVREIRGWEPVRSFPEAPEYVRGVLNLRGVLVPVVDLRLRFGMPPEDYTSTTVVIVVSVSIAADDDCESTRDLLLGLVVDSVSDVLECTASEMRDAPDIGANGAAEFMAGMLVRDEHIAIELDPARLLGHAQLSRLAGHAERSP